MTEKKIGILIRRPCKKERIERKINEHRKNLGNSCTTTIELEIVLLKKNKDVSN